MNDECDILVAIIDGDESICRSMTRLLKAAGIDSEVFFSAEKFLEDPHPARFDCLLLDIQMDGMSGLELHEQLNAEGSKTPIVFITAHDAVEVRIQATSGGCAGFFRKSDSGHDVITAIRTAVSERSSPNKYQL